MVLVGSADDAGGAVSARAQRLRASGDVRAVFAARTAAASPHAVVHVRDRGDAEPARVAVVAGKNVGNAVARNHVKRRLRAALRTIGLPNGRDYVVIGRPAALAAPFQELSASLLRIFHKMEGFT